MIGTDELIRQLAGDIRPLGRGVAWKRLALGVGAGVAVSLAAIAVWLGPPFQAAALAAVLRKLMFPAVLLLVSFLLLLRAGRPGQEIGRSWLWLLVPPMIVAVSATIELSASAPQARDEIWLGSTWQRCLAAILVLSLPVFAGIWWAFRRLAPTRLRLAGFLAGATSGSAAASLYALYCPETTATFLVSWYSLGIASAGLIGALIGPKLLRW